VFSLATQKNAFEGDTITLTCSDAGSHQIDWTTPRGTKQSENSLTITNIQRADEGVYLCYYSEGMKIIELDSYYVHVLGKYMKVLSN